jgi:hypothetical protein
MKRLTRFWTVLLGAPSSKVLFAFAIGVLVIALLGNLCYDALMGEVSRARWPYALRTLIVGGVSVGLAYLWYCRVYQRLEINVDVDESRIAPQRRGLIWLFGPNYKHLFTTLKHHQHENGPEHCWLILEDTPLIQEKRQAFEQQARALDLPTAFHPITIRRLDVQSTYRAVRSIVAQQLPEYQLEISDIIADITSGTKPMSAGMVLAALTEGIEMEYVESKHDEGGKPIEGSQTVVLLGMDFYLAEEESAILARDMH